MRVDRYTKAVLTVIAAALVWLCLWGPGPKWGKPVEAAEGGLMVPAPQGTPLAVNIAEIGGLRLTAGQGVPVEVLRVQFDASVRGGLGSRSTAAPRRGVRPSPRAGGAGMPGMRGTAGRRTPLRGR